MDLVQYIQSIPSWQSMLVLFAAAVIECIFPPFPGDTILVGGGLLIAQGVLPLIPTYCLMSAGSILGAFIGYWLGYHGLGLRRLLKAESIQHLEKAYDRWGVLLILSNRFIPAFRSAFMIAAGLIRMPIRRVLFWGTLSSLLWNAFLLLIGHAFSDRVEDAIRFAQAYGKTVLIFIGICLIAYTLFRIGGKKHGSR
ncbi:MAG: DedA family protein [Myxococcaceae bacterium]|nr:DedA family protein [Myxococcaceae bacterium]MBH2006088.1 DedA family protein [Myxococcaceae bacterium]